MLGRGAVEIGSTIGKTGDGNEDIEGATSEGEGAEAMTEGNDLGLVSRKSEGCNLGPVSGRLRSRGERGMGKLMFFRSK